MNHPNITRIIISQEGQILGYVVRGDSQGGQILGYDDYYDSDTCPHG